MTPQDARRAVVDSLVAIVPDADLDQIGDDAPLRTELELDSLDFLTFVEQLSTRTGIRIDEEDYPRLATAGSSIDLVLGRAG